MTDKPEKKARNAGFLAQVGKGRPKGVPNKATILAKSVIAEAAAALGGTDRMVAWVKEDPHNERVFWGTIFPKLVPVQVAGDADNPLSVITRVELVAVDPGKKQR